MKPTVVMLMSGGADSATLLYALKQTYNVITMTFDYGQRHVKEIKAAGNVAKFAGVPNILVDVGEFDRILKSSLTGFGEIPEGEYSVESQKSTVVPNRNAILINIAAGFAISIEAVAVAYAAHFNDQVLYPDCTSKFVVACEKALREGTDTHIQLLAPFIDKTKAEIIKLGTHLGVPYELTWSCYKGGLRACGKCGTCVERIEAFKVNELEDPIAYKTDKDNAVDGPAIVTPKEMTKITKTMKEKKDETSNNKSN